MLLPLLPNTQARDWSFSHSHCGCGESESIGPVCASNTAVAAAKVIIILAKHVKSACVQGKGRQNTSELVSSTRFLPVRLQANIQTDQTNSSPGAIKKKLHLTVSHYKWALQIKAIAKCVDKQAYTTTTYTQLNVNVSVETHLSVLCR